MINEGEENRGNAGPMLVGGLKKKKKKKKSFQRKNWITIDKNKK